MSESAAGVEVEIATRQACKDTARAYLRRAMDKVESGDVEHALVDIEFATTWLRSVL